MNGMAYFRTKNPVMKSNGMKCHVDDAWPLFPSDPSHDDVSDDKFETDYEQLRLFVRDVLFYVCVNDEKLNVLSKKIISLRRELEPRSEHFTKAIGMITRTMLSYIRCKMQVGKLQWHEVPRANKRVFIRYSREMLETGRGRYLKKLKRWAKYRVRKYFRYLGTQKPHDFFIYLAHVSNFCVTLTMEGTPYNEIESVPDIAAHMIYVSFCVFPNYERLQRYAEEKKFRMTHELFLMNKY